MPVRLRIRLGGFGESSTDLVFDGKDIICENGHILAQSDRYARGNKYALADIDIEAIRRDRMHLSTFADCANLNRNYTSIIKTPDVAARTELRLMRDIDPRPFVPPTRLTWPSVARKSYTYSRAAWPSGSVLPDANV